VNLNKRRKNVIRVIDITVSNRPNSDKQQYGIK